jgi:hypothetical protein
VVIDPASIPATDLVWIDARRIIRSIHPPIDLFEDIADPADWPLLISAEQKTNPRLVARIGALDLVPPHRRVGGPGASWLMAPFTHVSPDRPSRFSAGDYGVLYVAQAFETALAETLHHHARFMAATAEAAGWTSQFREIVLDVRGLLHDIRGAGRFAPMLDADDYREAQEVGAALHRAGSDGIIYPSVRDPDGTCAGLFWPDLASNPRQGRHLDYHWNGTHVDLVRDIGARRVFRLTR